MMATPKIKVPGADFTQDIPAESMGTSTPVPGSGSMTNLEENTQAGRKQGSIVWWLMLFLVYLGWDYIQTREKVTEAVQPRNIRANIHNLAVIGLAAVLFINGANVLLTKLSAMRIPLISKGAGALLPLFHL